MYKNRKASNSLLTINTAVKGETIEDKMNRIVNNGEPIKERGVRLIYQERKDGVQPDFDITTDKMEVALEAMDYASKSHRGKRNQRIEDAKKNMEKEKESEKVIKHDDGKAAGASATSDQGA